MWPQLLEEPACGVGAVLAAKLRYTSRIAFAKQRREPTMFLLRPMQFAFLHRQNADERRYGVSQEINLPSQMLARAAQIETVMETKIEIRPGFKPYWLG